MKIPQKFSAWLKTHQRPAWRPKVKLADPTVEGSKFAGVPWLAKNEDWPSCESCRRPMQFFFQLDLDGLPKGANHDFGHGVLQVFMCTWIQQGKCKPIRDPCFPFSEATLVRIVKAKGPGKKVDVPDFGADLTSVDKPGPCKAITGWSKEKDWPRPQDMETLGLSFDNYDYTDQNAPRCSLECREIGVTMENVDEREFLDLYPCLLGDKLGGWPFWIQYSEYHHCRKCQTMMTSVIFQLESKKNLECWFGRAGIAWILQCPKHKDILTFTWQC